MRKAWRLESQLETQMALCEPELTVERMGNRSSLIRRKLNQTASTRPCFGHRPTEHLLANPSTPFVACDTDSFDLSAHGAAPRQMGQECQLHGANDASVRSGCNDQELVGITVDDFEGSELCLINRVG